MLILMDSTHTSHQKYVIRQSKDTPNSPQLIVWFSYSRLHSIRRLCTVQTLNTGRVWLHLRARRSGFSQSLLVPATTTRAFGLVRDPIHQLPLRDLIPSFFNIGNSQNVKKRDKGAYYDSMWSSALATKPTYVSITSYNEWMEGTQIEAAVPKQIEKTIYDGKPYTYQDYGDLPPNYYIDATYRWAEKFVSTFANQQ